MFQLLAIVLTWLAWFGSAALVIRMDAKEHQADARARGEVDFMDRSVTPYLILSIFCGALPLVVVVTEMVDPQPPEILVHNIVVCATAGLGVREIDARTILVERGCRIGADLYFVAALCSDILARCD